VRHLYRKKTIRVSGVLAKDTAAKKITVCQNGLSSVIFVAICPLELPPESVKPIARKILE
jgi:hypothetical protein